MDNQLRQGPATFSIDAPASPVSPADVPQLGVAPTANPGPIAPGATLRSGGVSDADAKTMRAITDLASGVLAPKIKEAAQQQYIQGVQQAMTGEGLGEIIKDKPWYTDIFAPSAALAGARTYTAQRSVAEWAGKMQEQMPNLAKVGPEQLQNAAVGALQGFMTGDAATDAMMTQAVTEQMAPLFKQHAKEHYIYMQKQASAAQIGAWESLAKVYQGFAATEAGGEGTVSPEDRDAAKSRLLSAIAPFADQSDDSFERNVSAFLEGAATQGNFHVIRLFKEQGLYDKIPPDRRALLDRSISVAARQTLDKAMPQFAMDVAMLTNDMTQDPRQLPEKVAALNAKAAAVTGVTEASLIPPQYMDNLVGRVLVAQRNAADAQARAAQAAHDKDQKELDGLSLAASQLNLGPGNLDRCLKVGLCKEKDAETAGLIAYQTAKKPEDRIKVLNSRTLGAFESVKSIYTNTLRSPEYQAGVGQMAQEYQGLADNVKPLYFDETERALMDRFNAQVRAGMPPDAAWVVAKNAPSLAKYGVSENANDDVSKAIRSYAESQNENILGVNRVSDAALRTIEAATKRAYLADRTNNPVDVSVKRAYAQARANGLDIQGEHAVINVNPADRPLFTVVGESERGTAEAFNRLMDQKAKALGATLDNYEAFRVPDRGGKAYIYVTATTPEGRAVNWHIGSDELKAEVVKHITVGNTIGKRVKDLAGSLADQTQTMIDAGGN